jgi:hypothetical protein
MSLWIVIGWALIVAAFLQPLSCGMIAARKGRTTLLWAGLGFMFGVMPVGFLAMMLVMADAFGESGDSFIVALILLGCLWPLITIVCLPKRAPETIRRPRGRGLERRDRGFPRTPPRGA